VIDACHQIERPTSQQDPDEGIFEGQLGME
jgi:hypothetical protein